MSKNLQSSWEFLSQRRPSPSASKPIRGSVFILTVVLPALLWWASIHGRNYLIHPRCLSRPETCTLESIPPLDKFSVGLEDGEADWNSYLTQNFSGFLALGVPIAWNTGLLISSSVVPGVFWVNLLADLTLMGQTVAWNGLFTETSHLLTQRPRPFVYQDPAVRGVEPSHYTSFYSGHTSFVAATQTGVLLFFFFRGAPIWFLMLWLGVAESMIFSTAYFRIFAGRHFLTDVLAGAFAGTLVALSAFFVSGRASKRG